ncbi:MAG: dephospho-CoA kinase, partial [Mycobacteriaceae bacterium]|nr:dephospho-CoA kinase [Mycobacteriaceae bacterium]
MLRVGLTGGMGAGKSTVAAVLAECGAVVVDSDAVAREVVAPGTPGLAALSERFGAGILRPDGSLDRAALAAIAFADEQSRAALNAITHPRVGARTAELIAAAPAD